MNAAVYYHCASHLALVAVPSELTLWGAATSWVFLPASAAALCMVMEMREREFFAAWDADRRDQFHSQNAEGMARRPNDNGQLDTPNDSNP